MNTITVEDGKVTLGRKSTYDQIVMYKTLQYGKIAMKLRRGLISLDEAQNAWNEAERQFNQLRTTNEGLNSSGRKAFEIGLETMLALV